MVTMYFTIVIPLDSMFLRRDKNTEGHSDLIEKVFNGYTKNFKINWKNSESKK